MTSAILPRWRTAWTAPVLVACAACVLGIFVGRAIAHESSLGGLGGYVGSAILSLMVIVTVVGLVLIGTVATIFRHGHVTSAIATVLAAAGLLLTGTIGGSATAGALGGLYHQPVVLDARGETQVELPRTIGPFVARAGGLATCHSTPDGRTVAGFTAFELGELGAGTLRANVSLATDVSDGATGEFFIDGGDLPDGAPQPFWSGPVQVQQIGADGSSGRLTFAGLGRSVDSKMPDPESSAAAGRASDWPSAISGAVSWTCQPW